MSRFEVGGDRIARRIGVGASAIGMAASILGIVCFSLRLAGAGHVAFVTGVSKLLFLAGPLAVGVFAVIIVSRQPRNKAAWCIVLLALSQGLAGAAQQYGHLAYIYRSLPWAIQIGWLSNWMWVVMFMGMLLLLVTFPDGKLPARPWRLLVAFIFVAGTGLAFLAATLPFMDCCPWATNPYSLFGDAGIQIFVSVSSNLEQGLLGVLALCVLAITHRYLRAGTVQKAQIRWLLFAGFMFLAAQIWGYVGMGQLVNFVSQITFYMLPVALAIAIMRYRLYEIDRLINRTFVYGLVTAALATLYLGLVLLIQVVTPLNNDSPVVVAVSTLVVAALFRPARSNAQTFIDRRFNRQRYDAARTLEGFTARLRDEVDLDSLGSQLVEVVSDTMQPKKAALWLRPAGVAGDELS